MKRVLFIFIVLVFVQLTFSQSKIGYIDTATIIKQLPDAQDAQKQLDNIVKSWQEELRVIEKELKDNTEDYEKRKLIMSDQKRIEKDREIATLQGKISEFRQKKFGVDGELFKKQEELMKPIHNKIFTVVKEIAEKDSYDFIIDRSSDTILLYAKDKFDLTNIVIEKLK